MSGTARFALVAALLLISATALGDAATDTQALAKQAQNPIANLISVPVQSNTNFGVGPTNGVQEVLYLQPVIPFTISGDWNLITRWIVPLINQPKLAFGGQGDTFGMGDINPSFFLSHVGHNMVWGAGPTFLLPTASDHVLGSGQWGAGPTAVILVTPGKWVMGALANNIWSFASDGEQRPPVDQMLIQPFVNYNLSQGWYLTSSPIITSNWRAVPHDRWTVPLGAGFGRLVRLGKIAVNSYVQAFGYAASPDGGPDWSLRLQVQVLLPK